MAGEKENGDSDIIAATPTKEFFIDMLTRDISLSECILDLLDNSIHGLIRHQKLDVMDALSKGRLPAKTVNATAQITFSPTKFVIDDNCGGMSIKDAKNDVFLFGKTKAETGKTGLGVYGIGMKRAFFKIGKHIVVKSHTTSEEFAVTIDVKAWKDDPNWSHRFDYARQRAHSTGGTRIEVTTLNDVPKTQFALPSFAGALSDRIAVTYGLFLKAGLQVKVNSNTIKADLPDFASSKGLTVARHSFQKDGVDVLILVGATPTDDRIPRGWYVFCNGRCVLSADKTEKTGWGLHPVPGWHPRYNHFLGFVYFRSKNLRNLPWTTTKEGVDRESTVYQAALAQMRVVSRPAMEFFQRMYSDAPVEDVPEKRLLEAAKPTPIQKAAGKANAGFTAVVKHKAGDEQVPIHYKKPRKDVEKIKKAIGRTKMSASSVGEYTFDWYLRRNS